MSKNLILLAILIGTVLSGLFYYIQSQPNSRKNKARQLLEEIIQECELIEDKLQHFENLGTFERKGEVLSGRFSINDFCEAHKQRTNKLSSFSDLMESPTFPNCENLCSDLWTSSDDSTVFGCINSQQNLTNLLKAEALRLKDQIENRHE